MAPSVPPTPPTEAGFVLGSSPAPVGDLIRRMLKARELIVILARKEFFVRYRRTSFGLLWAVMLPLLQALVLSFVLSRFVRFEGIDNYPVFVFSGTMAWSFLSGSVSSGAVAIVDNASMSARIYFPRAILPLVAVLAGFYGLVLSAAVLVVLALVTGAGVGPQVVLLVPSVGVAVCLAVALTFVLSALHVYFRDVKYLVAAVLLPLFYLTPVFYPLDALDGGLRHLISANPATGVVELFRLATVGADDGWPEAVGWTLGWTAVLGVLGLVLQSRRDRVFADLL